VLSLHKCDKSEKNHLPINVPNYCNLTLSKKSQGQSNSPSTCIFYRCKAQVVHIPCIYISSKKNSFSNIDWVTPHSTHSRSFWGQYLLQQLIINTYAVVSCAIFAWNFLTSIDHWMIRIIACNNFSTWLHMQLLHASISECECSKCMIQCRSQKHITSKMSGDEELLSFVSRCFSDDNFIGSV